VPYILEDGSRNKEDVIAIIMNTSERRELILIHTNLLKNYTL
jgi:hypothetical protein